MQKKKQVITLDQDYKYLIDQKPEGFVFKPACGTVDEQGKITVSGMEFTEETIDCNGKKFENLIEVFSAIDQKMKAKKTANQKQTITIGQKEEKI